MINNVNSAPSPTSALSMQGPGGALGKDEFIKLLVAQMRHQDPLSPMKGEELAVQLAQFSTVEQLMTLNATMSEHQALNGAIVDALNANSALSAIGKQVLALGDQLLIEEDFAPADLVFAIEGEGGFATLRILNPDGKVVATQELGSLPGGRHQVAVDDEIRDLVPGLYTFEVDVQGEEGASVTVQTFMTGRVDGVRYGSSGPVLTAGPLEIPIGAILEISVGS